MIRAKFVLFGMGVYADVRHALYAEMQAMGIDPRVCLLRRSAGNRWLVG